ncbi:MAG: Crp/Fnr family transcriptional regulator, partial [Acidobacteria bacterium]|nr:Crp/Fnr family transcriptional regulator [Acidobacteriota bacterium]
DEAIVRQGEVGLGLYAILKGRVKVEREHAGSTVRLAELGPPQFFAEISMVDSQPRSATVTTLEETDCMLLTRDSFLKLVRTYPDLALRLARVLAERLRAADEKLAAAESAPAAPEPAAAPAVQEAARQEPAVQSEQPDSAAFFSKKKVQASMLDTFSRLYSMKAMVRFSVAVLGCPVEGCGPDVLGQVRVGEAKALLLPATQAAAMDIVASEPGSFTLHVFRPDQADPLDFGPVDIQPGDGFQLRVDRDSASLWNSGRRILPAGGLS